MGICAQSGDYSNRFAGQATQDCTSFRGRLDFDGPLPDQGIKSIRIGGFDPEVYGLFPAKVAKDLTFETCLPLKEYYITFPDSIANRVVLTMVPPAGGPLRIRVATRKHVTTGPARPLDILARARDEMVSHLPKSIRVIGLGESNHGTAEFYEERTDLAIELARHHQYSLLMIEAGFGEALLLDDYIKGANVAIADTLKALGYWMWRSKEMIAVLDKLRSYNLGAPASGQISIVGIDVQTTNGALAELVRQRSSSVSESELAILSSLQELDSKKWAEFSLEDKGIVRGILTRVAAARDATGLGSMPNRLALAARSILLRLELLDQRDHWFDRTRTRDAGMARMVLEVLSIVPHAKGTVWAHISHLSREFAVGAPTMGAHLGGSLGDAYQVWVLLAFEGAARARNSIKLGSEVVAHALPPPPDYLVEAALWRSGRARDLAVSYWSLPPGNSNRDTWLRGLRLIRHFGARFPDHREPFELYDLASWDGFVLFKHVRPTTALE